MKLKYSTTSLLLLLCLFGVSFAAEKIPVKSADDLPRITYKTSLLPSEIIQNEDELQAIATQVKADTDRILAKYDIADKSTLKSYYAGLRNIAAFDKDYETASVYNQKIKDLQDKPADKLTSGLSTECIFALLKAGEKQGTAAFAKAFEKAYAEKVNPLPWEIVQDNIESSKGSMEMYSENLIMGLVQAQMDPGVKDGGQMDFGTASALLRLRFMIDYVLPTKESTVKVLSDYIAANRVEKEDIWEARSVVLDASEELNEVLVAIWDSGVDVDIFEPMGKVWKNEGEIASDGIDNDGNGWVDDVYGIAHDLAGKRTSGTLFELPESVVERYDELVSMSKGLSDVQASVDSEEAQAFKRYMASLQPEAVESFILDLGYFGNYSHGTHVAGIAEAGNPAIKLLTARITFDHKVIPDVPTLEETIRSTRSAQDVVDYLKAQGVRVVNMSWGGTQSGIEGAYEANGVGDDSEMRAEMARILYELSYDALVDAMASAPGILFIPAAGNSDEDIEFNKVIPSSIALKNVLVAGAVDQAGDETDFTSYGKNVRVHANGFEVDSYIPGGKRQKFSGTSMSAPNVTNLAAKLLALDPSLTPEGVVSLILLGCDTSEDGRRHLMNPKKSVAMLRLRNGN